MRIFINGEAKTVASGDLTAVLDAAGFAGMRFATAVNEEFVPAAARKDCKLQDGDRVEIVGPMQGG